MWWETVLIALVPSLCTLLITNWLNKRKYRAEVFNLEEQGKSISGRNIETILNTYNETLNQYKIEIEDSNKRFNKFKEEANEEISSLKKNNANLSRKIDILIKEACFTKGCSKRTYFRESSSCGKDN